MLCQFVIKIDKHSSRGCNEEGIQPHKDFPSGMLFCKKHRKYLYKESVIFAQKERMRSNDEFIEVWGGFPEDKVEEEVEEEEEEEEEAEEEENDDYNEEEAEENDDYNEEEEQSVKRSKLTVKQKKLLDSVSKIVDEDPLKKSEKKKKQVKKNKPIKNEIENVEEEEEVAEGEEEEDEEDEDEEEMNIHFPRNRGADRIAKAQNIFYRGSLSLISIAENLITISTPINLKGITPLLEKDEEFKSCLLECIDELENDFVQHFDSPQNRLLSILGMTCIKVAADNAFNPPPPPPGNSDLDKEQLDLEKELL